MGIKLTPYEKKSIQILCTVLGSYLIPIRKRLFPDGHYLDLYKERPKDLLPDPWANCRAAVAMGNSTALSFYLSKTNAKSRASHGH